MTVERIVRDRFESGYCQIEPTDEPQVNVEDSKVRLRVAYFFMLHLEIMALVTCPLDCRDIK